MRKNCEYSCTIICSKPFCGTYNKSKVRRYWNCLSFISIYSCRNIYYVTLCKRLTTIVVVQNCISKIPLAPQANPIKKYLENYLYCNPQRGITKVTLLWIIYRRNFSKFCDFQIKNYKIKFILYKILKVITIFLHTFSAIVLQYSNFWWSPSGLVFFDIFFIQSCFPSSYRIFNKTLFPSRWASSGLNWLIFKSLLFSARSSLETKATYNFFCLFLSLSKWIRGETGFSAALRMITAHHLKNFK
jgi:hypothetical protein